MKQFKRWIILLLCCTLIISSIAIPGGAFGHEEHDKYMFSVLFRNFKSKEDIRESAEQLDALKMLEYASYLTIDQFNNQGEDKLRFLSDHGVNDIPVNIGEINYAAGGHDHRSNTHRGWDYNYVGRARELWPVLKSILLNTSDKIFDFNGDEQKKNSFCALIYYIHILGDHIADKSWTTRNGLKIDVGGRTDRYDIIHELEKHLKVLFKDQKHSHKYSHLMAVLQRYNRKLSTIVRSEGGINTDEKFQLKQEYTEEVMNALTLYIPEMLKEEPFFNEVFYNN